MNAQPLTPPEEPSVAGMKVRPVLPVVLYALLVGSALLALWAQRAGTAPEPVSRFAPWAFLAFAIGFAAYRLSLVAARRYSPFKAFSQIGVAAMFFMLLLFPQVVAPPMSPTTGLGGLLADPDPRVRALAAEVAGHRGAVGEAGSLIGLLRDERPEVSTAARAALVKLNGGVDLGADATAWKARFP